ncbi:MAG: biotin--[acetyl-CoA-carboxylase] ligase [Daejeonella sp.]|uniref:biotin--[acetyl-CoA-carboxylase] ligase n=1 Tax=Daejeonella sp. TaxID=2805397 RepID=UPI0027341C1C|nr:biotin--[acetyl-CoA-carboxylase] ligase [Daejeonella sp.]MDP3467104.1 biotin--[acetyl-CoA-carboxylase] ligase [Daejeonella sp.]
MQNNTFSGLFIGRNLITLKEVDSTNTFLKDALSKSKPFLDGTVIMADRQYSGRGQASNSWLSEAGKNLTFSVLLNPGFLPIERQFDLNMAISLALNDFLNKYTSGAASIKWPNDSYVGKKKIGGILIENIVHGNTIKHAIIGIGLNVNQENFPADLMNVTSLKQALHQDYNLMDLLGEICSIIESRYLQLKAGKTVKLRDEYLSQLYLKDTWALFRFDNEIQNGKIQGLSSIGQLILETANGLRYFNNKEIEFIN